ncbi:MAG: N-acetyltransferase [Chloroflexia bacterium]|nr:N-acetyltransferase [Chloroflexia bacterium]
MRNATARSPRTTFAIARDEEAIGSIGLMIDSDVHRFTAELGYWLAEPFWGKGIMTSAVAVITDYGFAQFKLNRIYMHQEIQIPLYDDLRDEYDETVLTNGIRGK